VYMLLWEFAPRRGAEEDFERAYGPAGVWAQFFNRDSEYRGTKLIRSITDDRQYITIDTWTSREAYETFRIRWQAEHAEVDRMCESLTAYEKALGTFVDIDLAAK
jgi:heme-degrading monooxygenase HmoA